MTVDLSYALFVFGAVLGFLTPSLFQHGGSLPQSQRQRTGGEGKKEREREREREYIIKKESIIFCDLTIEQHLLNVVKFY